MCEGYDDANVDTNMMTMMSEVLVVRGWKVLHFLSGRIAAGKSGDVGKKQEQERDKQLHYTRQKNKITIRKQTYRFSLSFQPRLFLSFAPD